MGARVFVLLLAAALAVAAAAGCGGSDASTLSAESQATVDEIEQICDDAAAKASAAQGEFPVEDFDPENPDPADLPAVGNYFSTGHAIWDEALAETRALSVPAEIQADVDTLLTAVENDLALAKTQAAAAKASDVEGFTATLDDVEASQESVQTAADALGVNCDY